MAARKDLMLEELRAIRREVSKRLLNAEKRDGTCLPELIRMGREADRRMRRTLNGSSHANGSRGGRQGRNGSA